MLFAADRRGPIRRSKDMSCDRQSARIDGMRERSGQTTIVFSNSRQKKRRIPQICKCDNRRIVAGDQLASRLWHPVTTRLATGPRIVGTHDPRPACFIGAQFGMIRFSLKGVQ